MLFIIWTLTLLSAIYLYLRKINTKLSALGINHLPLTPLLGNMTPSVMKKEHVVHTFERLYNTYQEDRIVGFYLFVKPIFIVKDLELMKKIVIKDFEYFVDRRGVANDLQDPLFTKSLPFLKGEKWKAMRSTLSPAFTSSKIRLMVPFMLEVGDLMINHLKKKLEESGVGYIDLETNDMCTRYANDVIATCAFGLKVDSSGEDNAFYLNSKQATNFSVKDFFKIAIVNVFPKITNMLNITILSKSVSDFFINLVQDTMRQREEQNVVRKDMIHLLMEAKKGTLSHDQKETKDADAGFATVKESSLGKKAVHYEWTDADLVPQAFIFLVAGFETVSTAMSFLLNELALHPEVQRKLYQEIKSDNDNNNGKVDYHSIQRMSYLDMVVSETLRLWPPAPVIERLCVKDYNLGKPNSTAQKDVIIIKNEALHIPVWAFHRNPAYFPKPDKFDPERFSDANKHNIKPFTYLPFGLGPRNCIASRFALCEVKVMVYQLLLNMEVLPYEKTCAPTRLASNALQMRMCGDHWLRMKLRS